LIRKEDAKHHRLDERVAAKPPERHPISRNPEFQGVAEPVEARVAAETLELAPVSRGASLAATV